VQAWFQAMEQRPTFRAIKSDYYTHSHDLPPQVGTCHSVPEAQPFAAQIDGLDGSWDLPLKPGVEPLVSHDEDRWARVVPWGVPGTWGLRRAGRLCSA
jgi:hypothetical protein